MRSPCHKTLSFAGFDVTIEVDNNDIKITASGSDPTIRNKLFDLCQHIYACLPSDRKAGIGTASGDTIIFPTTSARAARADVFSRMTGALSSIAIAFQQNKTRETIDKRFDRLLSTWKEKEANPDIMDSLRRLPKPPRER